MTDQFAVWVVAPSVQYTLTSFEVFFTFVKVPSSSQVGLQSEYRSQSFLRLVFHSSLVLIPSKFDVTFGFAVSLFYEAKITG